MNKKRILNTIILLLSIGWGASSTVLADEGKVHRFVVSGVVVNSGNGKSIQKFVDYLSHQANYPMDVVFVDSYARLSGILRKHPDAFAWTCGAPFVEDAKSDGQQLVSVPLFNGTPTYHSVILAKKGTTKQQLRDFEGEVFVYSDPRSNSGYISPKYALKKQSIDMEQHFRLMVHSGSHERSIEALQGGLADVAAVDEYVWVEYLKKYPQAKNELVEIERMGPFPFTPIVAGSAVSKKKIITMNKILGSMKESEQGKKYLDSFGLDGFVQVSIDFFDPIEKMLNKNMNNE